jgi:hypothetical protein
VEKGCLRVMAHAAMAVLSLPATVGDILYYYHGTMQRAGRNVQARSRMPTAARGGHRGDCP